MSSSILFLDWACANFVVRLVLRPCLRLWFIMISPMWTVREVYELLVSYTLDLRMGRSFMYSATPYTSNFTPCTFLHIHNHYQSTALADGPPCLRSQNLRPAGNRVSLDRILSNNHLSFSHRPATIHVNTVHPNLANQPHPSACGLKLCMPAYAKNGG